MDETELEHQLRAFRRLSHWETELKRFRDLQTEASKDCRLAIADGDEGFAKLCNFTRYYYEEKIIRTQALIKKHKTLLMGS